MLTERIEEVVERIVAARNLKDWDTYYYNIYSLHDNGVVVEFTPEGALWKRITNENNSSAL